MQPVLSVVFVAFKILARLLEAQPFHNQSGLPKALLNLLAQPVVGQQHHLQAAFQQRGQHIGLQKIDHRQTMVGADENAGFRHRVRVSFIIRHYRS